MKRRKAYGREEKLMQIVSVFLDEYRKGKKALLAGDVGKAIDNAPSTKLRKLLLSLIIQGVLEEKKEESANIAGFIRWYRLSPEYLDYTKTPMSQQGRGREIRINTRKGTYVEVLR